jgi:hypothetical protein
LVTNHGHRSSAYKAPQGKARLTLLNSNLALQQNPLRRVLLLLPSKKLYLLPNCIYYPLTSPQMEQHLHKVTG